MTPEQKSWKKRLKKLGVSQNALARMCLVNYAEMNEYLNLKREPRTTRWMKIENKLQELESRK